MMKNLLISVMVTGWIIASIQLIRSVFSNTLDHGILTVVSIALGLLLTAGLNLVFSKIKIGFNWPMAAFFLVFLSTACIGLLNYQLASPHHQKKEFVVKGSGGRVIRFDLMEYVRLTDGTSSFKYMGLDKGAMPRAGDVLEGTVRKGFFGFDIVEISDQP